MVCVPCIVVPLVLWIWHKFIQPYVLLFWNPWAKKVEDENVKGNCGDEPEKNVKDAHSDLKSDSNLKESFDLPTISNSAECKKLE